MKHSVGNDHPRASRLLCLAALFAISTAGCSVNKELVEKESVDVAVEHLLQAIDQAVESTYQEHGVRLGLSLQEVAVQLKTLVDKKANQDFTVSVLEIEAGEDESFTQTVTLTLDPPKKQPTEDSIAQAGGDPRLVQHLEQGFHAAMLAARGAKAGLERVHPEGIPLTAQKVTVTMAFSLTIAGDGVPSISILGIDLTAERTRERVHTVTLTFSVDDSDS